MNKELRFEEFIPKECLLLDNENKKEPFFIHCHIPKTSGTSFNNFLEENLENQYFDRYEGRFIHMFPKINYQQIIKYIENYYSMKGATSHMFDALLPYDYCQKKIIGISFLRDPIDRFISMYFHMKKMDARGPWNNGFEDYLIHFEKLGKLNLSYLNYLTHREDSESFKYIQTLVEKKRFFLFNLENSIANYKVLNKYFPNNFNKLYEIHDNISIRDEEITLEQKKRIKKLASPYDYRLIELANTMLKEVYTIEPI